MRWKQIIVIIYISQLIYFIYWGWVVHLSLSDWLLLLTLECTVVLIMFEWFRRLDEDYVRKLHDRGIECKKLEGYVHVHNQEMINLIFKYWFYENNKPTAERQRTIEHLQTGYPDIWNLKLECDVHKIHLSESEKSIRGNIKNKFEQYTPPGFEWVITLDNMGQLLYKAIEGFSIKGGTDEDYKIHLHNFGLFGIRKKADKNDKYLMETQENFRKLVEDIVNDKTLIEQFKFISREREFLKEKTSKFKQSIEDIKHDFEKRNNELKGICEDCKEWHDELESLK